MFSEDYQAAILERWIFSAKIQQVVGTLIWQFADIRSDTARFRNEDRKPELACRAVKQISDGWELQPLTDGYFVCSFAAVVRVAPQSYIDHLCLYCNRSGTQRLYSSFSNIIPCRLLTIRSLSSVAPQRKLHCPPITLLSSVWLLF
jgi:hypothetical protein